jgi:hypothetical protein
MLLNFDLSGAEWNVVAYLSQDPGMQAVVRSGKSPHIVTGAKISGLPEDVVKKEASIIGDLNDPIHISELRQTELKGLLDGAKFLPRTMSIRQAGKKCLVAGTEVLTPEGWVKIEDVKQGDKVLQWDAGELSFVETSAIYKYALAPAEELIALKGRHFSQTVTANHRLPLKHLKKYFFEECTAATLPENCTYGIPLSGNLNNKTSLLNAYETRLLVAIQADGVINPYGQVVFKFAKERKRDRLDSILSALGISVTITKGNQFHIPRGPIIDKLVKLLTGGFVYERQERHAVKTLRHGALLKNYGLYLLQLGITELQAFVNEQQFWDGHNRNGGACFQAFTTNKNNADWIQTISHLCGCRCTLISREPTGGFGKKTLHWLSIGKADTTTTSVLKRSSVKADSVYCLTVPSGFFMVRYESIISISGNSNHSLNYRLGYRTFAQRNEMDEKEAQKIVNLYRGERIGSTIRGGAYPELNHWYDRIDEQIRKTRTMTNCFGRKMYFMGQMGDDLFREATAAVPQSTVVDITNRAMPLMLNDSSPAFEPAKLLAQVHDSTLIDYVSMEFHAMARFVIKMGLDYLSPTLDYGEPFKLGVDLKAGVNWGESMKKIDMTPDEDVMAERLKLCWKAFSLM